jgi:PAS domain S-box-containing protein
VVESPFFEEAFENAPHAMAVLAHDGAIVRANRSLCQLVGFARADLEARNVVHIIHADDVRTESEQRRRLASADIGRYELVLRYLRKNGAVIWVRLCVSGTRRPRGKHSYLIASVDRVASPKARVGRKTDDVWLRNVGDAALAAAHEIGNSLTPLMLNAEMILEHARKKELRDSAQQIFKAARRIAFALRRMRGVEYGPPVAYVGQERMLDLRMIAPPPADRPGSAGGRDTV